MGIIAYPCTSNGSYFFVKGTSEQPHTSIIPELISQKSLDRRSWITPSPIAQGFPTAEGWKAVLYPTYHVINRTDINSFCGRTLAVIHFQGGCLYWMGLSMRSLAVTGLGPCVQGLSFVLGLSFHALAPFPLSPMVGKVLLNSSCTQPHFVFHISIGIAWWEGALCCQELLVGKILLIMYSAIVAQYHCLISKAAS